MWQRPPSRPILDMFRTYEACTSIGGRVERSRKQAMSLNSLEYQILEDCKADLEDFSALTFVHRIAMELNEGIEIELVPTLDDPKNLFERVLDGSGRSQTRKAA